MSYDPFDQYASWLPECNGVYPAPIREPEPVQDYTPRPRHLFDGHLSPSASINPAPRQSIEPFDSASQELRIVLHRHPVKPEFLQNTYKEAKKNHGQIRDCCSLRYARSWRFTVNQGIAGYGWVHEGRDEKRGARGLLRAGHAKAGTQAQGRTQA